ncbi:MAG: Uma2 family endonuclease [Spirulinaceae cyanobacterium]
MVSTPLALETQYPDSDGQLMADNTEQYQWIVRLVENLKALLQDQIAFVAGDLLWYPQQVLKGEKAPRQATDAMVVLGRPDGYRGSYKQWEEEDIAPQVVFEILSPSNTLAEMTQKQQFYQQHGAQEIYFYDPQAQNFWGLVRAGDRWNFINKPSLPWVSPTLGIRFELFEAGLEVFYPDGTPFKTFTELTQERDQLASDRQQLQTQLNQVSEERDSAQTQLSQTQTERDAAQAKLAQALAKLKAAGIDVDELG